MLFSSTHTPSVIGTYLVLYHPLYLCRALREWRNVVFIRPPYGLQMAERLLVFRTELDFYVCERLPEVGGVGQYLNVF